MRQCGLQEFWCRKGGNVAIIFSLMLLPICAVVGASIDLSRQVNTKQTLEEVTDIAVLAGGKKFVLSGNFFAAKRLSNKVFAENISNTHADVSCRIVSWSASLTSKTYKLKTACKVPTLFGSGISGRTHMRVKTSATAQASVTTLDLALVVDLSDSMNGSRIAALKTSAKSLVDTLIKPDDQVRISLVPYNNSVNAGEVGFTALNRNPLGSLSEADPEGDGRNKICLTERVGPEAYTDATPGSGAWMGEPNSVTDRCDVTELMPLESDANQIKQRIDAMTPPTASYTAGHMGVAWGWYTISPKWSSIWPSGSAPKDYGNPDNLKAMVIMTDGSFNLWDWIANGLSHPKGPQQARSLCQAMKAEGIAIFTIAFEAPASSKSMLKDCASSDETYFDAANATELQAAYESIAGRYQGVALSE